MSIRTQHELMLAEDQLRISMMRGDKTQENKMRQVLIHTVADGDAPENIRTAASWLLRMEFVSSN